MSAIEIGEDYVVVGGVRLPRRKAGAPDKKPDSTALQPQGEAVSVPMPVLQQMKDRMDSMQNQIDALQAQMSSIAPEQRIAPSAEFLGRGAMKVDYQQCFVAIPYSKPWSKSLQDILSDVCKTREMKTLVAKEMDGRFIPNDIWKGITGSSIVIGDITDGNPNVAYEIGLADSLGKEVILLCQERNVPFDFLAQRLIFYENTIDGSFRLKEELSGRLRQFQERPAVQ